MKQYSFTDDELRLAAASVCASMVEAAEAIPGGEHEFSESFLEKMDALVALDKLRRKRRQLWHRVASVFLAFLLGASIFLATNPEARATFLAWVREVYENSVVYRFFGSSKGPLPRYEPTWIPEGYVLDEEYEENVDDKIWRDVIYVNSSTGDVFILTYQTMTDGLSNVFTSYVGETISEPEHLLIKGAEGDYYTSDTNTLIWCDEDGGVAFMIGSTLPKDVILHIAESIILSNSTK